MKKRIISRFLTLLILISLLPTSTLAQNVAIQSASAAESVSESVSMDETDASQTDEDDEKPVAKTIDEAADLLVKSVWEHYAITEIRWDKNVATPTDEMVNEIIERAWQKSGGFPFGEARCSGQLEKTNEDDTAADWQFTFVCLF